jgi:putative ABC transport system permease protein
MLSLRETVTMSVTSVASHKVRSMLTILGVVFGVAAVMAMLSIGEGAKQEALEQIAVMGLHNVIIRAQAADESDGGEPASGEKKATNSLGLTVKDADAIAAECSFAEIVEANAEHRKTGFHGGEHADLPVLGVTPAYAAIYNTSVSDGRFLPPPMCGALTCTVCSARRRSESSSRSSRRSGNRSSSATRGSR